ncbi:MAG: sialidase family protein [Gemmatimonadaceae bacterium]|nr:sialidase family protein [Gemmatimonadaceae bacterium]
MMPRPSRSLAALVALTFVIACRGEDALVKPPVRVADEAPAASPGASTPHLTTATDGTVWMSWMERGADSAWVLRAAHRPVNGGWSAPVVAVRDSLIFANWADFPSIAVDAKGRLIAHFLRRSAPGKYSYHVWVTASADSGATWSAPQRLHSDTSASEHGFAALVPQPDGSTFAAWLDGHATGGESGAMNLGFGVVDSTLRVRPDTMLDMRVCDCCQVAGTSTGGGGAVFAYRDRSETEVRDIAVVRYDEGRWWPPAVVHADGWVTRACPVNGPALSSRNHGVALAWFTNARDTAKVHLAFSTDRGATWSTPVRVDDGAPLGRVDVEYLADGGALVTWMEQRGKGTAEIRAKRVRSDGVLSSATVVSTTSDARAAGFPRIAAASDTAVYVAWREMANPARLRVTLLRIPDGR